MSLDGLLTLVGIVIAVYALAQPIQRQSVRLFAPKWFIFLSIIISAILLLWRYAVPTFCYQFYPESDMASVLGAFFFPIIGAITAYVFWNKAKLKKKKDKKFQEFILTSYYEDKFDELMRILKRNDESLQEVLEPETLDLLFERKFIRRMIEARNWIHLSLFSIEKLVGKLPNRYRVTDNIIREFVDAKTSPLHLAIVKDYGGREYLQPTKKEWELIEKTLQNPEWYMQVRIDYALTVLVCCEVIPSGKFDETYNKNGEWYIIRQGESARLRCPVYLALKTHVILLKKAIEKEEETEEEKDYYTSDLWNLFQSVCDHSRYDESVWEDIGANSEYPTAFAYLMKEILYDLEWLCDRAYKQGDRSPEGLGYRLIGTWATCVANLGISRNKVSDKFKFGCIGNYLSYALKMMEAYEGARGERKENIRLWRDGLVEKLKTHHAGGARRQEIRFQSMNNLDYGKRYIWEYHEWLRSELELPELPSSGN